MHTNLVVSIWQSDAVKGVIDIFTAGRINRADLEVPQIPSLGNLLGIWTPVLAFRGQAVYHFLRKGPHVNIELMQDHVCFRVNPAFLANNLDELAEGKR